MTLVEVLIGGFLTGAISMGVAGYGVFLSRFENEARLNNTANEIQMQTMKLVQSDVAWSDTVDYNVANYAASGLGCTILSDSSTGCKTPVDYTNTWNGMALTYPKGNNATALVFSDNRGPSRFSYDGKPCLSTDTSCPFVHVLRWTPICGTGSGGGPLCSAPLIRIMSEVDFTPLATNQDKKNIAVGDRIQRWILYRNQPAKYLRSFTVGFEKSGTAANRRGGQGTAGAWTRRGLNYEEDLFGDVTLSDTDADTYNDKIEFTNPSGNGAYYCEGWAVGVGVGAHALEIRWHSASSTLDLEYTIVAYSEPTWQPATNAQLITIFEGGEYIELLHRYDSHNPTDPMISFGRPSGATDKPDVYLRMRCWRQRS